MAWSEQWSIKVDSNEINDITNYITNIPEIDDMGSEFDVVTSDIQGGYPVFIRVQPKSSTITFNIQMTPCSWANYQIKLQYIKGIFTPVIHTLTVQVRGMTSAKSVQFVPTKLTVGDPKERRISITALVPKPVLV